MNFSKRNEFNLDLGSQFVAGEKLESLSMEHKATDHRDLNLNEGLQGRFVRLPNDFSPIDGADRYQDQPHWTSGEREKVKRFRFVICLLALASLSLSLMSRVIMNLTIVDMVMSEEDPSSEISEILVQEGESVITTLATTEAENATSTTLSPEEIEANARDLMESQEFDAGLRFAWSKTEQNALLGSFYVGYMPAILLGGGIADKYGSRYPLLLATAGSSLVNMLTPTLARYHYFAILTSRVLLGVFQGAVVPSLYDTFNKWLTENEASIFAPLIKVSMPLGSLMGAALPGIMSYFGFKWPYLFYLTSSSCLLWSIAWLALSSSDPHSSKFVDSRELHKITRKKQNQLSVAVIDTKLEEKIRRTSEGFRRGPVEKKADTTPWLLIITNPSVIALTFLKYTYNISMDFFYIELSTYLDNVHDASSQTISLIASCGYLMQVLLIVLVGWAAKTAVSQRALGLSVTKWRKVFQGSSNFAMAAIYFVFPLLAKDVTTVAFLIIAVWFFWMLGAGGESLVPYDLSTKYPAAIVGFAHSISILSGLSVPVLCTLVIGKDTADAGGWNVLFIIIGCLAALGGLVFTLVLKAKPFLPEERVPKQNGTTKISIANGNK